MHYDSSLIAVYCENTLSFCETSKLGSPASLQVFYRYFAHYKQVSSFPLFVAFVYRSLSAVRYRIHLNLCIALAAAQLVFIAGIEATDIKVRIAYFVILISSSISNIRNYT